MKKKNMIEDIANIQYYIKTNIYNEFIDSKEKYLKKIMNIYNDMSIEDVKENLEDIKLLAITSIKLDINQKIEDMCIDKKVKAYEEYINKCKEIELETNELLILKNKELESLKMDNLINYINNVNKKKDN